jgi:hypothetical protein
MDLTFILPLSFSYSVPILLLSGETVIIVVMSMCLCVYVCVLFCGNVWICNGGCGGKKKGQTPGGVCPFYSRPCGSELVHNRALLLSDWCLNRVR